MARSNFSCFKRTGGGPPRLVGSGLHNDWQTVWLVWAGFSSRPFMADYHAHGQCPIAQRKLAWLDWWLVQGLSKVCHHGPWSHKDVRELYKANKVLSQKKSRKMSFNLRSHTKYLPILLTSLFQLSLSKSKTLWAAHFDNLLIFSFIADETYSHSFLWKVQIQRRNKNKWVNIKFPIHSITRVSGRKEKHK